MLLSPTVPKVEFLILSTLGDFTVLLAIVVPSMGLYIGSP